MNTSIFLLSHSTKRYDMAVRSELIEGGMRRAIQAPEINLGDSPLSIQTPWFSAL